MVFLYIEIVEMWFRIFFFSFAECIVEVHTVGSTFFVFFFLLFYLHRDYEVTDISLATVAAIEVALCLA